MSEKMKGVGCLRPQFLGVKQCLELARVHQEAFGEKGWSAQSLEDLLVLPTSFVLGLYTSSCSKEKGTPLEEALCAFVLYQVIAPESEIITLAVLPEKQGEGVGTELLKLLRAFLKKEEVSLCRLEVSKTNLKAQALYKKVDFSLVGERKGYYREEQGQVDALLFEQSV